MLDSLVFLLLSVLVGKFSQAHSFNSFPFLLTECKNIALSDLIYCLFVFVISTISDSFFELSIVVPLVSSFKMQVIMEVLTG